MRGLLVLLVAIAALFAATADAAAQGQRKALVIGNQRYSALPSLGNPEYDAKAIAQAFQLRAFRVTLVIDADLATMRNTVDAFVQSLQADDIAVFYYAGHAVSVGGENFLGPTDASLAPEADVTARFLRMNDVIGVIAGSRAAVKLFFSIPAAINCRTYQRRLSIRTSGCQRRRPQVAGRRRGLSSFSQLRRIPRPATGRRARIAHLPKHCSPTSMRPKS